MTKQISGLCFCGSGPQKPPQLASSSSDQVSQDGLIFISGPRGASIPPPWTRPFLGWSLLVFTWNCRTVVRLLVPGEHTHQTPCGSPLWWSCPLPAGEGQGHCPPSLLAWPGHSRPPPSASAQLDPCRLRHPAWPPALGRGSVHVRTHLQSPGASTWSTCDSPRGAWGPGSGTLVF